MPKRRMKFNLNCLRRGMLENTGESRTLDFFDAPFLNYPYPITTTISKAERIQASFTLRGERNVAEILPAQIKDGKTGRERLVFPGGPRGIADRALRLL
jgi:hypothetical protein